MPIEDNAALSFSSESSRPNDIQEAPRARAWKRATGKVDWHREAGRRPRQGGVLRSWLSRVCSLRLAFFAPVS
jgi:hypothetical protein